jgi:hypothetical protein
LEPRKPGHVRVYRGQTKKYPQVTPSGLREAGLYRGYIWRSYTQAILFGIPDAAPQNRETPLSSIWIEAIAQHYGSGSKFLDVTTNLDTAAWFALHEAHTETTWRDAPTAAVERVNRFGTSGRTDVPIADRMTRYSNKTDGFGWLYVFDVPLWSGESEPVHGDLIELASAPDFLKFQMSERMKAQSACLITADRDVSAFCKCPPIALRWPLTGNEAVLKPAQSLFPSPDNDPWYALFLSIPLAARPGPSIWIEDQKKGQGWIRPVGLRWARPLPVTFYLTKASGEAAKPTTAALGETLLDPPFIYPLISTKAEPPSKDAAWIDEKAAAEGTYRLDRATVIMLESPLISMLPRLNLWNHALLLADIATGTESFHAREMPEGKVVSKDGVPRIEFSPEQEAQYSKLIATPFTLTNVFLELSPLEEIRWAKIGGGTRLLRALWLTHNRKRFFFRRFYQILPSAGPARDIEEDEPLFYEYDDGAFRFARAVAEKNDWRWEELAEQNPADGAFFGMLSVLRALSPGPGLEYRADPFPAEAREEQNSKWAFKIAIRRRTAHLAHGSYLEDGRQILAIHGSAWSVHEGWHANEPYDSVSAPVHSFLNMTADSPWPDVDAESIRRWINENLNFKV